MVSMEPEGVPDSLVEEAVEGWHNAPHVMPEGPHTVPLDDVMRHVLAAVLPAYKDMVKTDIVQDIHGIITTEPFSDCHLGLQRAIELIDNR